MEAVATAAVLIVNGRLLKPFSGRRKSPQTPMTKGSEQSASGSRIELLQLGKLHG
jgi:hypothetical protein